MNTTESVFTHHKQLHDWSCSASAHEFIAKLHEKIELDAYPLQHSSTSERAGFQFEEFLNTHGCTGHDDHLTPQECIDTFQKEISDGRYPLVSVLSDLGTNHSYWHIVAATHTCQGIGLADPAKQVFMTQNMNDTLSYLESLSRSVPNRPKIHVLTYRNKYVEQGGGKENELL